MDLYNILIFTTNPGAPMIRASFKFEAKARNAYDSLATAKSNHTRGSDATTTFTFDDDYSRRITIDIAHVIGIQFAHVNVELNGEADLGQLQQHAQVAFQKRMQGDPMMQQGKILQAPAFPGMNGPVGRS